MVLWIVFVRLLKRNRINRSNLLSRVTGSQKKKKRVHNICVTTWELEDPISSQSKYLEISEQKGSRIYHQSKSESSKHTKICEKSIIFPLHVLSISVKVQFKWNFVDFFLSYLYYAIDILCFYSINKYLHCYSF